MKKQYDFSKSKPNPYAARLRKQVTLRLGTDVIAYFKGLAAESDIPYQKLIDMYLRDCAQSGKKLQLRWAG